MKDVLYFQTVLVWLLALGCRKLMAVVNVCYIIIGLIHYAEASFSIINKRKHKICFIFLSMGVESSRTSSQDVCEAPIGVKNMSQVCSRCQRLDKTATGNHSRYSTTLHF